MRIVNPRTGRKDARRMRRAGGSGRGREVTVTVDELVALLAAAQAWEHTYRTTEAVPTTADLPRILDEINRAGAKLTAMLEAGKA